MEVEILRKKVKRVTLRVHPDLSVKVTAPMRYPQEKITAFVEDKKARIEKTLGRLKQVKQSIPLKENELLLHGEAYSFLLDKELGKKVVVDIEDKLVAAWIDLLDEKLQLKRYKSYAKETFLYLLNKISLEHNVKRAKLSIRDSQTRWGSCSSVGNISLSWRLIRMPSYVMDYVIAHELAHRREMNHSKRFWAVVDEYIDDKEKAMAWIKQYGSVVK